MTFWEGQRFHVRYAGVNSALLHSHLSIKTCHIILYCGYVFNVPEVLTDCYNDIVLHSCDCKFGKNEIFCVRE